MHDGLYATLNDVVWHYSQGVAAGDVPGTPALQFQPLNLTADQQSDLVEFLKTLSGAPLPGALINAPTLPP
jgi:hypothetical protein